MEQVAAVNYEIDVLASGGIEREEVIGVKILASSPSNDSRMPGMIKAEMGIR